MSRMHYTGGGNVLTEYAYIGIALWSSLPPPPPISVYFDKARSVKDRGRVFQTYIPGV